MGSTERSILTRLKTNLEAVDGTGGYNYDFSAADSVIIGSIHVGTAPKAPGIYIHPLRINSSRNAGRTLLRNYDRECTVQIDVFVPRTSEASDNAVLAAVDAVSDVMRAIELDPDVNGLARDVELDVTAYDGEQVQLPGYGIGTIQLFIEYAEQRGT